jgi:hypothetical protein
VGSTCGRGRVNEGDESEGIWLMDFIYLYLYTYMKLQETSCNCFKWDGEGLWEEMERAI